MTLVRRLKNIARRIIEAMPPLERAVFASAGYRVLTRDEAQNFNANAKGWHSARSAARQERAYDRLLAEMRAGHPRLDLAVAAEAVVATGLKHPRLLEVGCGNGYYSEILEHLTPGGVDYTGLDYSPAMIANARARLPAASFVTGDATRMPFDPGSFDVVVNGVCLMHIMAYGDAIADAARVTNCWTIFHCVPVFDDHPTAYLSKYAYGEPVVEIIFNRGELEKEFERAGLQIVRQWEALPYDVFRVTGAHSHAITYLCRKAA